MAVLALGLGIGLTTVMYGIVYGVYLRDLPFDEPEELMRVGFTDGSGPSVSSHVRHREFLRVREEQESFERLVGWVPVGGNVRGPDGVPRRMGAAYVSSGFFETVDVEPVLGRTFRSEEETPGTDPVAVISDDVWRDLFDRDPGVLGRTIRLYGNLVTVVGVGPPEFQFPYRQNFWLPLGAWPEGTLMEQNRSTFVFGRLADGISREVARAEMEVLLAEAASDGEEASNDRPRRVALWPYVEGHSDPEERASHLWMLGILFAVLLIACANVGGLLLHRVAARERETRIRSALGADRWHTLAPVLAELGVLTALGGVVGVGLAAWGLRIYDRVMREDWGPYWAETRLEPSVLAFALGVTLLAAILAVAIPAWRTASHRRGLDFGLRSRAVDRGTERWGKLLVVGQITLCCGLLMITGLMVRSLTHLAAQGSVIDTENLWTGRFSLYGEGFPDDDSQRQAWAELTRRLESLPEVESVGLVSSIPGSWSTWTTPFLRDDGETEHEAFTAVANPRAFDLLGLTPLLGRVFTEADSRDSEPVIVVSRSFARRVWGPESPVGRHLRLWPGDAERRVRVIGVVPDLPMGPLRAGDEEILYLPLTQMHQSDLYPVVRTRPGARDVPAELRRVAASLAPDQPLDRVQTLEAWLADSGWTYRTSGVLFSVFGLVALFLACLGLYGVLSFQAQRRLPEWGVRMALGASRGDLFRRVTWSSAKLVILGLVLGGVLGGWASRYMASLLYRVEPVALPVFAAMAGVLLVTAFLAGLAPARRAAYADPTTLLREE